MKGIIVDCIAGLVTEKFGHDKWEKVLELAGLPRSMVFLASRRVKEQEFSGILSSLKGVLGLGATQAAQAFGDYWGKVYSRALYEPYYRTCSSAREFLLKLNDIHRQAATFMKDSGPPRFRYNWRDDGSLILSYDSERGLTDFVAGLVRGAADHYKEPLRIEPIADDEIRVVFGG